jgi:REP element-mobilizing transposase RayT
VHLIFYHLVWTPERRTALLVGEIERECRALIQTVAAVHATNGS